MALIDRYISEVVRRLPAKERDDIGRELRSTMEDLLPVGYSEKEEHELLKKFGDPAVLARHYRSQPRYLIGPSFLDLYVTLLKIILPIAVVITVIVVIITTIFAEGGEASIAAVIGKLVGNSIGGAFDAALHVFFWVTLVFFIIEWVDQTNRAAGKPPIVFPEKGWAPEDLEAAQIISKKKTIPRSEPLVDLIWTAIWLSIYFNAEKFLGIYGGGAAGVGMTTPVFNQEILIGHWPLVMLVAILQIVMDIWKWTRRRWDLNLAIFNFVIQSLAVLAVIRILTDPEIFGTGFLSWFENVFSSLNALDWIVGGIIFTVALFAVIDIIQGFRKAAREDEAAMKGWKIRKG